MNRFFTADIQNGIARITGEDVRHIARVLRLRTGDAIAVCDGRGYEYTGTITALSDAEALCVLSDGHASETESAFEITLFQGLPKAGKLETIVQKCVELGVYAVVPTVTARCVAELGRDFSKKLVRLNRVSLEAAKQSRRGIIPKVLDAVSLEGIDLSAFDRAFVAYEDEHGTGLKAALRSGTTGKRIALIVGPEGGFEQAEIAALTARGAGSVSLGKRILRTETAGMAMLAEVLYELE